MPSFQHLFDSAPPTVPGKTLIYKDVPSTFAPLRTFLFSFCQMIFKSLVQSAAAAVAFVAGTASATMAPTYPSPGTVWTVGKQYTLTWCKSYHGLIK